MNETQEKLKEIEKTLKEANKALLDYVRVVKINKVYFELEKIKASFSSEQ
jgi:hypothetical protein